MLPLIPLGIASLAGGAWWAQKKRKEKNVDPRLQAERDVIFDTAMNSPMSSEKLRDLAVAFRKAGLVAHADMLDKRALLKDAPQELKNARQDALRKGLASTDIPSIRRLASAFEVEGCAAAATKLREYAQGLEDSGGSV